MLKLLSLTYYLVLLVHTCIMVTFPPILVGVARSCEHDTRDFNEFRWGVSLFLRFTLIWYGYIPENNVWSSQARKCLAGKFWMGHLPKTSVFFSLPNPDITTMSEDAGFGQRGIFMSLFTVYLSDLTYVSFFAKLYMWSIGSMHNSYSPVIYFHFPGSSEQIRMAALMAPH